MSNVKAADALAGDGEMNSQRKVRTRWARRLGSKMGAVAIGMLAVLSSMPAVSLDVATVPLSIGSNVPGNLALVPSVEYPTIISKANLGAYDSARTYVGYFDASKCYSYIYNADETLRRFEPTRFASNHACSAAQNEWSGNYLNWAATQTIDPFRSALTGGYRVRETPQTTWLEKARHDRNSLYPNQTISSGVNQATPAAWGSLSTRIQGLGNKMYLAASNDTLSGTGAVPYDPGTHELIVDGQGVSVVRNKITLAVLPSTLLEVSVRVAVCVSDALKEANCKRYQSGWKPEGLIQEYSGRLRYSIFGYLNDSAITRDGGVLRARQKFVGPFLHYPDEITADNTSKEWNPATGELIQNPDQNDATATGYGVANSGVINYLNRFGQMSNELHKSIDPVSELYYAAVRYFKNQGNVPDYSTVSSYAQADGFPVITNWDDPIRYRCQANVILGIGDVYTHRDKNLPGATSSAEEPAKPSQVTADTTVNVIDATQKVFDLEGINKSASNVFTGRNNSAFIAGLAYDSHTRDIRPDVNTAPNTTGMQTISTFWVDVRENQRLEGKADNQYWLAAKYGGFRVPEGYDPYTRTEALDPAWWHNTVDYLNGGANGGITTTVTDYPRADNFYVASEADKMVQSLREAFRNIIEAMTGSGGSFASNTTKLETGAMTYQAQFYSGSWRGDLVGYTVNRDTGALTQAWTANFPTNWTERNIRINNGGTMQAFTSLSQATALGSQEVVDYLRGDRTREQPAGTLRTRQSVLGDIVNSQPVYVGAPNNRLFYGAEFTGASTYGAFAVAQLARTPTIYVGANDGMLHAFNATTGRETFAFIPSAVVPRLQAYSNPGYVHQYYVDGEITVADVFISGAWKTILVGTLGRGGRGVYALDVTNPSNVQFLWEKTSADIPALGNVLSKPIIAQVADGDWRVMMGNGPNGTGGTAQLVTINLRTGTATTVNTGVGSDNGMSGVNVWNTGATDFADVVYAGDLAGNLWKITNLAGTPTATSIFQANYGGTAQPITAAPMVSRHPTTRQTWIYFGTGRYLNEDDLADQSVQTWYGLIDRGSVIAGRSGLAEVSIVDEVYPDDDEDDNVEDYAVRLLEENTAPGVDGWYIDLISSENGVEGERMVVSNIFQGLTLIGTTRIPENSDVCNPSGRGWVMAIDPFTGGRLPNSFFDSNGDGDFDAGDEINGNAVSGLGMPSGPNNPIFVGDVMLTNMDNAESNVVKTKSSLLAPARVSWREVVAD